jgi:acetoacetyl-CoA synthetase
MASEKPLWQPGENAIRASNLARFTAFLARHYGAYFTDSRDLHAFSIRAPGIFWPALWDFFGVIGEKGAKPWLTDAGKMPGAHFFPNGRLNFAENLLARPNAGAAVVFWGEDKVKRRLTWDELAAQVSRLQHFMRAEGVGVGDRVAAMLPNCPEALVGMLAAASLGAIWSSCSPDFGVQGALDRFGQIEPKLFIACDGYWYNGKRIATAEKVQGIKASLPSAASALIVSYLGEAASPGTTHSRHMRQARSTLNACPLRILSIFFFPPARRACPNASCTRRAVSYCSI